MLNPVFYMIFFKFWFLLSYPHVLMYKSNVLSMSSEPKKAIIDLWYAFVHVFVFFWSIIGKCRLNLLYSPHNLILVLKMQFKYKIMHA